MTCSTVPRYELGSADLVVDSLDGVWMTNLQNLFARETDDPNTQFVMPELEPTKREKEVLVYTEETDIFADQHPEEYYM